MRRKLKMIFAAAGVLVIIRVIAIVASTDNLSQFGQRPEGERLERIKTSPNYKNDSFVNPNGFEQSFEFDKMRKIIPHWVTGKENREPEESLPIEKLSTESFTTNDSTGLRVAWLGHNTAYIEIDGMTILADPVWAERYSPSSLWGPKRFHPVPIEIEDLPHIDAVIISHDHYDHLDKDAVIALNEKGTTFYAPLGVGAHLESWGVDITHIVELDWWDEVKLENGITLAATPAVHFSGRSMPGQNKTLWATWAIVGPKHRVYYGGDSGLMRKYYDIGEKYGPFDISFMPIGAYGDQWPEIHLTPEEAVEAHQRINGGVMIPIHWGTFNLAFHDWYEPPERLVKAVMPTEVQLLIPQAGQMISLDDIPPLETWWRECK